MSQVTAKLALLKNDAKLAVIPVLPFWHRRCVCEGFCPHDDRLRFDTDIRAIANKVVLRLADSSTVHPLFHGGR